MAKYWGQNGRSPLKFNHFPGLGCQKCRNRFKNSIIGTSLNTSVHIRFKSAFRCRPVDLDSIFQLPHDVEKLQDINISCLLCE